MPKMRIGLMGTFGYGNLGDAAIQDAMIQNIYASYPDGEIFGFSINPEDTEARHHIHSFPITRMSWKEEISGKGLYGKIIRFLRSKNNPFYRKLERWVSRIPIEWKLIIDADRHIKELDILVISGGGQLDDLWAGGGPWSHPYTLLKYGLLSKLRHVRFLFVSVGAGPIDASLSKLFIRLALQLSDYCSFRDEDSKNLIRSIGFKRNCPVFPDPAYSLKFQPLPGQEKETQNSRPILGLGMVGYYRQNCWPIQNDEIYESYLQKISEFCCSVVHKGYRLLFLPGETFYDQIAFDDLRKKLVENGITSSTGDIIDCPIESVTQLLTAIQMTEIVVTSRFHGVLLSQLLEKPVLAISYHKKIDCLMDDTGQGDFVVAIHDFDVADLLQKVSRLGSDRKDISTKLRGKNMVNRSLLEEQYKQIYQ